MKVHEKIHFILASTFKILETILKICKLQVYFSCFLNVQDKVKYTCLKKTVRPIYLRSRIYYLKNGPVDEIPNCFTRFKSFTLSTWFSGTK